MTRRAWVAALAFCSLMPACDSAGAPGDNSLPTARASDAVTTAESANTPATNLAAGDKERLPARPPVSFADAQLDALFEESAAEFAANGLGADGPESPLLETAGRWRAQLDRCVDAACRRSLTHDVRRRLSFGLGRSRGEIAGIPWRIGFFHSPPGEDGRQIGILPLEGGRIVIRIDTVTLSGNWECQLIATGSIDDDGNGVMHLVGDPANWRMLEGEPGRFMLRTRSPTEIVIEPMQPSPETGFCRGSHMGEYRASTRLLRRQ